MQVEAALLMACLSTDVDVKLIEAIIEIESGGKPTAFNVNKWNGETFQSDEADLAAVAAREFINAGFTVDVGLMQINSVNIFKYKETVESVFDPCVNMRLGEKILIENIEYAQSKKLRGHKAIRAALSLYNTGTMNRGFNNGYVDKVWTVYRNESDLIAKESPIDIKWTVSTSWVDENIDKDLYKQ